MFTYAHVNWIYGQSERAYYLIYFIIHVVTSTNPALRIKIAYLGELARAFAEHGLVFN